MRLLLVLLILVATPAQAWEFRPGPVCELTHAEPGAEVRLTYDPAVPEYTITLRRPAPWPAAPSFSIAFDGPRGLTIATTRHVLSGDGAALTVTDTGFGNVLDGLQFNRTATASAGGASVTLGLEGAAPAVAAFRACAEAGIA